MKQSEAKHPVDKEELQLCNCSVPEAQEPE